MPSASRPIWSSSAPSTRFMAAGCVALGAASRRLARDFLSPLPLGRAVSGGSGTGRPKPAIGPYRLPDFHADTVAPEGEGEGPLSLALVFKAPHPCPLPLGEGAVSPTQ